MNAAVDEIKKSSVAVFCLLLPLAVFIFDAQGHTSSPDYVYNVVGPDIFILDIVATMSVVLMIGCSILGWWRATAVLDADADAGRDDVFETLVGITAAVSASIVGILLIAVTFQALTDGIVSLAALLPLLAVTFLYVGAATATGLAVGTVTDRSITGRIGAGGILLVVIFFQIVTNFAYELATGKSSTRFVHQPDPLLFLFRRFDPRSAYVVVTNWIYGIGNSSSSAGTTILQLQPRPDLDQFVTNAYVAEHTLQGDLPWFLSQWVSLLVLLCWLAFPLAVIHWQTR